MEEYIDELRPFEPVENDLTDEPFLDPFHTQQTIAYQPTDIRPPDVIASHASATNVNYSKPASSRGLKNNPFNFSGKTPDALRMNNIDTDNMSLPAPDSLFPSSSDSSKPSKKGHVEWIPIDMQSVQMIKSIACTHPNVYRAITTIIDELKTQGLQTLVNGVPIDPRRNMEITDVYMTFLERAIWSFHAVGYVIFKIAQVDDSRNLVCVPIVQDFSEYTVKFTKDHNNDKSYCVFDANDVEVPDMLVKAIDPPDSFGNLQSPLAKVVPHIVNVLWYEMSEMMATDNAVASPYVVARNEKAQIDNMKEQNRRTEKAAELTGQTMFSPNSFASRGVANVPNTERNVSRPAIYNPSYALSSGLYNSSMAQQSSARTQAPQLTDMFVNKLRGMGQSMASLASTYGEQFFDANSVQAACTVTYNAALQRKIMTIGQGWMLSASPNSPSFPVDVNKKKDILTGVVAEFCRLPRFYVEEGDAGRAHSRHANDMKVYLTNRAITVKHWYDIMQQLINELVFHIYQRAPYHIYKPDKIGKQKIAGTMKHPIASHEVGRQWAEAIAESEEKMLKGKKNAHKNVVESMEYQKHVAECVQSWVISNKEAEILKSMEKQTKPEVKETEQKQADLFNGESPANAIFDDIREQIIEHEGFGLFAGVTIHLIWKEEVFDRMRDSGMFIDPLSVDLAPVLASKKRKTNVFGADERGASEKKNQGNTRKALLNKLMEQAANERQGELLAQNPLKDEIYSDMDVFNKANGGNAAVENSSKLSSMDMLAYNRRIANAGVSSGGPAYLSAVDDDKEEGEPTDELPAEDLVNLISSHVDDVDEKLSANKKSLADAHIRHAEAKMQKGLAQNKINNATGTPEEKAAVSAEHGEKMKLAEVNMRHAASQMKNLQKIIKHLESTKTAYLSKLNKASKIKAAQSGAAGAAATVATVAGGNNNSSSTSSTSSGTADPTTETKNVLEEIPATASDVQTRTEQIVKKTTTKAAATEETKLELDRTIREFTTMLNEAEYQIKSANTTLSRHQPLDLGNASDINNAETSKAIDDARNTKVLQEYLKTVLDQNLQQLKEAQERLRRQK